MSEILRDFSDLFRDVSEIVHRFVIDLSEIVSEIFRDFQRLSTIVQRCLINSQGLFPEMCRSFFKDLSEIFREFSEIFQVCFFSDFQRHPFFIKVSGLFKIQLWFFIMIFKYFQDITRESSEIVHGEVSVIFRRIPKIVRTYS